MSPIGWCRAVWLFSRIVWRRFDFYLPTRLDWRTAWKVARIIYPRERTE